MRRVKWGAPPSSVREFTLGFSPLPLLMSLLLLLRLGDNGEECSGRGTCTCGVCSCDTNSAVRRQQCCITRLHTHTRIHEFEKTRTYNYVYRLLTHTLLPRCYALLAVMSPHFSANFLCSIILPPLLSPAGRSSRFAVLQFMCSCCVYMCRGDGAIISMIEIS